MAYHFHKDRKLYFEHQRENASRYVIPFIEDHRKIPANAKILEIGCGEGGVLKAFIDQGHHGTGVELDPVKIKDVKDFLKDEIKEGRAQIIDKNIFDADFQDDPEAAFDVIILKDVIEHIHDQPKLFRAMHHYLKPNGVIFFGFPPWHMPFGGHQQVANGKLAKAPWIHVLPWPLYRAVLKAGGEDARTINILRDIWETRITIGQFQTYCKQTDYEIVNKKLYLFNPIYHYKFGIQPREQFPLIGQIPYLRNFVTTCGYYLIKAR